MNFGDFTVQRQQTGGGNPREDEETRRKRILANRMRDKAERDVARGYGVFDGLTATLGPKVLNLGLYGAGKAGDVVRNALGFEPALDDVSYSEFVKDNPWKNTADKHPNAKFAGEIGGSILSIPAGMAAAPRVLAGAGKVASKAANKAEKFVPDFVKDSRAGQYIAEHPFMGTGAAATVGAGGVGYGTSAEDASLREKINNTIYAASLVAPVALGVPAAAGTRPVKKLFDKLYGSRHARGGAVGMLAGLPVGAAASDGLLAGEGFDLLEVLGDSALGGVIGTVGGTGAELIGDAIKWGGRNLFQKFKTEPTQTQAITQISDARQQIIDHPYTADVNRRYSVTNADDEYIGSTDEFGNVVDTETVQDRVRRGEIPTREQTADFLEDQLAVDEARRATMGTGYEEYQAISNATGIGTLGHRLSDDVEQIINTELDSLSLYGSHNARYAIDSASKRMDDVPAGDRTETLASKADGVRAAQRTQASTKFSQYEDKADVARQRVTSGENKQIKEGDPNWQYSPRQESIHTAALDNPKVQGEDLKRVRNWLSNHPDLVRGERRAFDDFLKNAESSEMLTDEAKTALKDAFKNAGGGDERNFLVQFVMKTDIALKRTRDLQQQAFRDEMAQMTLLNDAIKAGEKPPEKGYARIVTPDGKLLVAKVDKTKGDNYEFTLADGQPLKVSKKEVGNEEGKYVVSRSESVGLPYGTNLIPTRDPMKVVLSENEIDNSFAVLQPARIDHFYGLNADKTARLHPHRFMSAQSFNRLFPRYSDARFPGIETQLHLPVRDSTRGHELATTERARLNAAEILSANANPALSRRSWRLFKRTPKYAELIPLMNSDPTYRKGFTETTIDFLRNGIPLHFNGRLSAAAGVLGGRVGSEWESTPPKGFFGTNYQRGPR